MDLLGLSNTREPAQRMCQNRSVSDISKSIMITMLSQSCSAASGGCHADSSTAKSIIRLHRPERRLDQKEVTFILRRAVQRKEKVTRSARTLRMYYQSTR